MTAAAAATRTGLFNRLRFHIGPRTLRSQGVSVENVQPLYDCRKLPWWSRWTYFLVAADLVMTAGACELTWNHWTTPEEPAKDAQPSETPAAGSEPQVAKLVPRPWWQRGIFVATNLVAGIGIAAVLLGARSRMVRRMYIIPNPASSHPGDRLLVIQSPLHPRNHGAVYPLQRTRLVNSPDPSETMIGLKDDRGHYSVTLNGAEVGGQKMASVWDARKALFTMWYGEKKGAQLLMNSAKVKEDA